MPHRIACGRLSFLVLLISLGSAQTLPKPRTNYAVVFQETNLTAMAPLMSYLDDEVGRLFNPPLFFSAKSTGGSSLDVALEGDVVDFTFADEVATVCAQAKFDLFPLAEESRVEEELDGGLVITREGSDRVVSIENITGSTVASLPFFSMQGFLVQAELTASKGISVLSDAAQVTFYEEEHCELLLAAVASGAADVGFVTLQSFNAHPEIAAQLRVLHRITVPHLHNQQQASLARIGGRTWAAGPSIDPKVTWAVTQALVRLTDKHPAAVAAQAAGFRGPRSVAAIRSVLEEQGVLRYEGAEQGWKCLGRIQELHDFVTCPDDLLKVPEASMLSACNASGRVCPAAASACLCSPCLATDETTIRSFIGGVEVQGCSKLSICSQPPQLDTVAFELEDNMQRHAGAVEVETLFSDAEGMMVRTVEQVPLTGSSMYFFNLSFQYVGLVTVDVRLGGAPVGAVAPALSLHAGRRRVPDSGWEQIPQSPFFLLVQQRTCDAGREPSDVGECRCESGRMEVLRHCVARGAFLSGMLLPPLVVLILVIVVFVRAKIKAADAFWVIDIRSLSFESPPECIGQGPSGEVIKAHLLGTEVAVKTHWYEVKRDWALDMSESGLPRALSTHSFSRMSTPSNVNNATIPPFLSSSSWRQMEHAYATSQQVQRTSSITVDSFFGLGPSDSGSGNPTGKTELHVRLNKLLERHNRDRPCPAENDNSSHSNPNQRPGQQRPNSDETRPHSRRMSVPSLLPADDAMSPTQRRRRSSLKPTSPKPTSPQDVSPKCITPKGNSPPLAPKLRFQNGLSSSKPCSPESRPASSGLIEPLDLRADNPARPDSAQLASEPQLVQSPAGAKLPDALSELPQLPEASVQRAGEELAGVRAEIVLQVEGEGGTAQTEAVRGPSVEGKGDLEVGGVLEGESEGSRGKGLEASTTPASAGTTVPLLRAHSVRCARATNSLERASSHRGSGDHSFHRGRSSPWAKDVVEEEGEGGVSRWLVHQWGKLEALLSPKSPASTKFVAEMRMLSRVRHPCVTTVMGAVVNRDHALIVMEFMRYGSLQDLYQNEMMELDGDLCHPILTDVAAGMHFIHSQSPPIIHGDLKAGNILVDERFRAKVSDFGFSIGEMDGTLFWMAPEVLLGGPSTKQSDAYSFGVLLCELLSRKPPYEGESATAVMMGVINKDISKRPEVPADAPTLLKRMMAKCWSHDPEQRPNFAEIRGLLGGLSPSDFSTRMSRKHELVASSGSMAAAGEGEVQETNQTGMGNGIVYNMFPKHVADALMKGERAPEDRRDCATVLFCDIVGFTTLSAQLDTTQVSDMLNRLFIQFDDLATQHGIHKLETIGDCYIGVSNLVESQPDDHVARMARFSLGILDAAKRTLIDLNDPARGHVVVRVGFDAGPVVGNVVGTRHLKYTVFGNTVNTASRMESTSVPGKAQCTKRAAELLMRQDAAIRMVERGQVEIKGKGTMTTFFLVPASERLLGPGSGRSWDPLHASHSDTFIGRPALAGEPSSKHLMGPRSPVGAASRQTASPVRGSSPVRASSPLSQNRSNGVPQEEAIYVTPRRVSARMGAGLSIVTTDDAEEAIRAPRRSSLLRKMKSSRL